MTTYNVGYFVGSLAKASINRKLSRALVRLAPKELQLREISFGDLPLYSYDYDADYPPAGKAIKEAIAAVDAVLFVTPEYNRSPNRLRVSHQQDVVSKERLDEWLDDALADTFPASDPVASPPSTTAPEEGDRSASTHSSAEAQIPPRSRR